MGQYDITIASANPTPSFAATSFRVEPDALKQDITPASSRRSDGDTRFLTIQTESFYSQNDWSAGFGLVYPPDPTSYQDGPADTLTPHRLRASYAPTTVGVGAGLYPVAMCRHNSKVYCVFTDGATQWLLDVWVGGSWTLVVALASLPKAICSFRDKIWISFGDGGTAIKTWDGATLATPTNAPTNAYELCPFGSMLFYLSYSVANGTWRVNRYDPENTATVPDLAILPYSALASPGTQNRALAAVGADLYIAIAHALWKFTSATGNTGVLSGPLDAWVPTGGAGATYASSSCMVAYQGGLHYSAGSSVRRYFPGGQPRTIWPDVARVTSPGQATDDDVWALEVVEDRLWLGLTRSSSGAASYDAEPCRLLAWDGLGMHHVGSLLGAWSANKPGALGLRGCFLVSDGLGVLVSALRHNNNPATGLRCGYYKVGGSQGRLYLDGATWKSSRLDFGMLDVDKAVSQIGMLAVTPVAATGFTLETSVDGGAWEAWTFAGPVYDTAIGRMGYFAPPTGRVRVGKLFELRVTFDVGVAATATTSPEIWAIVAIPNPINPLRRGFHWTFILDEAVEDHTTGARLYQTSAAVATALALVRQLRTETHPLLLTWLDGGQFYVRINTVTEHRVATVAGSQPAWRVTVDAQEIT